MLPEKITAYLADQRDRQLAELVDLLRFPSVSSQSDHEADCLACAEHLAGCLRGLGLTAELRPWRRHPVLIARSTDAIAPDGPTVLIYGHYDVQPPEPLDAWTTPPFDPRVRDGAVYARGASDDKGQLFAHLKALEAFLAARGRLPVRVVVLFEGEEEIGSPDLERFVADHADELRADCAVVTDSQFFAPGVPTITYGLRGLVYVELAVTGPAADLHSGTHGGAVVNPLNALARLIAAMHDDRGRVALPGFYDDVVPLTDDERDAWDALPFDEAAYARSLGVEPVGGEAGLPLLERRWARPTLDCHGVVGGYAGEGAKTVLPASATAKISMRLVPHQRPEKVLAAFGRFCAERAPAGVEAKVTALTQARPVLVPIDSPAVAAAADALREAFDAAPAMVRNGASVPVTELIQRILGVEPVVTGFGLPDDNLHAPDEHFRLDQFYRGIAASAACLLNLRTRLA